MEPIYIKNFLPDSILNFVYSYCLLKFSTPEEMKIDSMDFQSNSLVSRYADPVMETLLDMSTSVIEKNVGKKLFPTNSYLRIYDREASLPIHLDRGAAEFTVALCLGADPIDKPYEIFVGEDDPTSDYKFFYDKGHPDSDLAGTYRKTKITHKFSMLPNDAVIFRGGENIHWREYCEHDHFITVFLHYVDQNGENKDLKFDKRESLCRPIIFK